MYKRYQSVSHIGGLYIPAVSKLDEQSNTIMKNVFILSCVSDVLDVKKSPFIVFQMSSVYKCPHLTLCVRCPQCEKVPHLTLCVRCPQCEKCPTVILFVMSIKAKISEFPHDNPLLHI